MNYKLETIPAKDLEPGMVIKPPGDRLEFQVVSHVGKLWSDGPMYTNFLSVDAENNVAPGIGERTFTPPRTTVEVFRGSPTVARVQKAVRENVGRSNLADNYSYTFFAQPGTYTIGSDPEGFVFDRDGRLIPAPEFLPSKAKATPRQSSHGGYPQDGLHSNYFDGFQWEVMTCNPTCLGWLTDDMRQGLNEIHTAARAHNPYARLVIDDMIEIPETMRMEADDAVVALGCAPSQNIYGHKPIDVPDPRMMPFRSAGAHMHFGFKQWDIRLSEARIADAIFMLDALFGCVMTSLFEGLEGTTTPKRRVLYGRAGEYRPTPYGFEYRTPGPALYAHPGTWNLCWDVARRAASLGLKGLRWLWDATAAEARQVLNDYDVQLARTILERNRNVMLSLLRALYHTNADITYDTILRGLRDVAVDAANIERNWSLGGPWTPHAGNANCSWSSHVYGEAACITLRRGRKI